MRYLPHTKEDIESMLKVTGNSSLDDLFDCIPDNLRTKDKIDIPESLSEWELNTHMEALASANIACKNYKCFIGAGSYDHYIPAIVPYLISRSEFMTAYTPYQPEISQGTLQGIYEFQTMVTRLLGMDIATASHYDCGTALAESALIALKKNKKTKKIAVSSLVHPSHRQIVHTYLAPAGYEMVEISYTKEGLTDITAIEAMGDLAGIAVQSPNFFGNIEDLSAFKAIADAKKGLFIVSFTEAMAYGLLKSPGSFGADLVAGEGQSLGIPKSFGGPGLGLLAGTKKQMRNLPGRFVGKTKDTNGKDGFVLTLATREQHIRREKASSNICSNNGLNAMTAGIYLATVGKIGIQEIAQQNHDKAQYMKNSLLKSGFEPGFNSPFFNEFVLKAPKGFEQKRSAMIQDSCIFAGLNLETFYPELKQHYLFCATETISKDDIDQLAKEVQ
ncbi:aminomethyl-transferring glycine dehydrogenase subunit GcvPA [Desulfobacula toluolica]|uniref:GcvPA: glycine dehydrogenase (Decarboxylating), glycine cleavage system P protein, subunit 1 n=1 Tax=Desulfobacula toluolica (strain DSM 7467 / Tol2) TaxID=651182 RepID=K0NND1_DESTT|nr:aminomethyl-transferring glycine dehydrogenase subunit GcvPA [Desulfobacula toluolica]CCK80257.1 GcvPA: glycine dehydrogenase (decarboxylating), glycine cleavage system P protein, subunit 1 [Desulfobacula toluolica Tol2]